MGLTVRHSRSPRAALLQIMCHLVQQEFRETWLNCHFRIFFDWPSSSNIQASRPCAYLFVRKTSYLFLSILAVRIKELQTLCLSSPGHLHMPLKDGCRIWNWEYAWDYVTSTHCAPLYVPARHFDTSRSPTADLEMSHFKYCLRVFSIARLCRS